MEIYEQKQKVQRYKLTVEYDGTSYCGFQKQSDAAKKSIAEVLESCIFKFSQQAVKIIASGRTDAGVHALGQVIHFDLKKKIDPYKIITGLNHYLRTENIAILNCKLVDENFHARFNALMRYYRYRIINRKTPLVLEKNRAWHVAPKLNIAKMQKASKFLIGRHDFSSFRDAECQSSSAIRTINKIAVTTAKTAKNDIFIDIGAKSFLHHMVRNIVGTLVFVGLEKTPLLAVKEILLAKNRTKSGPNAPACGLYFLKTNYTKSIFKKDFSQRF
jgi:tRNA pseudouridine38-40 synthase